MERIASLVGLTILASLVAISTAEQKHWALLVAGSYGYGNYRHQADVCHAYHTVSNHGIPDEQIVVMMYDDIAYNSRNPFPGNIINRLNGPNVYPGTLKDYTGDNVNPEVFLKVLTGDAEGVKKLTGKDGKVIKSGPDDTVFVYFSDHGGLGVLAFRENVLHAKQLKDALLKMHQNKQYKELVLYIEACHAGSLFQNILPRNISVFATTASGPNEDSYGCYLDKKRQALLGDEYSIRWMEDSDAKNINNETLQEQFEIVKNKTKKSHVHEYGDLSMKNRMVGQFQGDKPDKSRFLLSGGAYFDPCVDAVKAEDIELTILYRNLEGATRKERFEIESDIKSVLEKRQRTIELFERIIHRIGYSFNRLYGKDVHFTDFTCYMNAVDTLIKVCPGLELSNNYYALKNLRVLANACESNIAMTRIFTAIELVSSRSSICTV